MGLVGVVVASLASWSSAAVAVADPGAPGLSQASNAVYPQSDTGQVLGISGAGSNIAAPGGTATHTSSALPFTGFLAPVLLAASLLLLGAGFGLRRLVRPKSSDAHQ